MHICTYKNISYLDLSQSVFSLPVPNGEDVVVGVIYNTQCVSPVLTDRSRQIEEPEKKVTKVFVTGANQVIILTDLEKDKQTRARSKKPTPRTWRVLRLTESHTRT